MAGLLTALLSLGMVLREGEPDAFFSDGRGIAGDDLVCSGAECLSRRCRPQRPLLEVVTEEDAPQGWFLGLPEGLLVATSVRARSDGGSHLGACDFWLAGTMQPRFGTPGPGLSGGAEATRDQEDAWHAAGGLRYSVTSDVHAGEIVLDTRNSDGSADSRPRIGIRVLDVPCHRPVHVEVHAQGGLGRIALRITLQCSREYPAVESGKGDLHEGGKGDDRQGTGPVPWITVRRFLPDTPGLREWALHTARWWHDL